MMQEIIDQVLHLIIGAALAYAISMVIINQPLSACIVVTCAFIRELWQHEWSINEMGAGSWRDMFFWTLGATVGSVVTL